VDTGATRVPHELRAYRAHTVPLSDRRKNVTAVAPPTSAEYISPSLSGPPYERRHVRDIRHAPVATNGFRERPLNARGGALSFTRTRSAQRRGTNYRDEHEGRGPAIRLPPGQTHGRTYGVIGKCWRSRLGRPLPTTARQNVVGTSDSRWYTNRR